MLTAMQSQDLESSDGLRLHVVLWPAERPKADVLLVHDYGEDASCYAKVSQTWVSHNYNVWAWDLRGHGASSGPCAAIEKFEDYLDDLDLCFARVRDLAPGRPVFLLGHGLGALIATLFVQTRRPRLRGLVLSAMITGLPLSQKEKMLSDWLSPWLPQIKLRPGVDLDLVPGDAPQAFRTAVNARTAREILGACRAISSEAEQWPFALLSLVAEAQGTAQAVAIQRFHDRVYALDKQLFQFSCLRFEMWRRSDLGAAAAVLTWLEQQMSGEAGFERGPPAPNQQDEDEDLDNDAL